MVSDDLIARCIRKEPKAQYALYRELHPQMLAICSRYERNEQDAVARMNAGFLKILTHLEKRRPEVPFTLWSRRIMINTVIDAYRKERERREHETLNGIAEQFDTGAVNDYLREMEAEAFAELLRAVPDMSRKVFNLFAIDGYTHVEIADMLGIGEGTSKWHVSNARNVLRTRIAQLQGERITKIA